jgi:DnaJ-class molecular chaperone
MYEEEPCPACGGDGEDQTGFTCPRCDGRGYIQLSGHDIASSAEDYEDDEDDEDADEDTDDES